MARNHCKITDKERDLIALWLAEGVRKIEIAKRLGRSHTSISDEIKRNGFKGHYVAIHAQVVSQQRKSRANRKKWPLKNKIIDEYVHEKLRLGWSPEQIAGRLPIDRPGQTICFETIYSFIYSPENKKFKLWEYLPRKQKKRRKKSGRKVQKTHIPNRVSIHQRPSHIALRTQFGHWEGDSVIGRNQRGAIHTQVERKTGYYLAVKMKNKSSTATLLAQAKIFTPFPVLARLTDTLDNGTEFVLHEQFLPQTYFADPYCSCQRGSNENANGLLRRYIPKKTDFSSLTQSELDDILHEINNRPRKRLNYHTPQERFDQELLKIKCRIPTDPGKDSTTIPLKRGLIKNY